MIPIHITQFKILNQLGKMIFMKAMKQPINFSPQDTIVSNHAKVIHFKESNCY
jgi:hypothetical protein